MVEAISYWWCYSVNQSCCFPGKERVKPWRESGPRFCGTLAPDGDGESKVDERKKFSPNILPMRAFSSFRLSSQVEQLARVERLEQELGREQDRLRAMLNHLTTSTSGSRVLAYTYDYAYTLAQPPPHWSPQVVQGYIDYNHAVSTSNIKFVLNAHVSQMGDSWPGPGGGERFAPQGRQLVARYKGSLSR